MTKKQKKVLYRIIISLVLLIAVSIIDTLVELPMIAQVILYLIPYFIIGYDILRKAGKGILNRQVFDENFLMAVATVGAILLGDFREGSAVMLFYQIGELFQSFAGFQVVSFSFRIRKVHRHGMARGIYRRCSLL